MKLKGGCFHHDNGPLGAKSYDRAEERKAELLKASGFNAIRCSHNPPSPAFLDACDRLGMLVIDEAFDMWQYPKNPDDYNLYFGNWWEKDIESMILRDRNHPSVILWSIGNEIPGMDSQEVVETARMLAEFVRKTDPTRLVTAAVNNLNPKKDPYFATTTLQTANAVSQIKLTADRTTIKSDGQDLSFITLELTDANGIRNPKAENLLSFEIEGPGRYRSLNIHIYIRMVFILAPHVHRISQNLSGGKSI